MSNYPIQEIRSQFPALNRTYNGFQAVFLDGPGGSQILQQSIDAIVNYMQNGSANLQGQFPTSRETEENIQETREILADLVGAQPAEVAFGQNATSLAFSISRAVSKDWQEGDEIVLSEIDHPANIDPWLSIAKEKKVTVRWLRVDTNTLSLDLSDLQSIINPKTRLVAVTLASNAIGTITNIKEISKQAKKVHALLAVDAVHAVPHFLIDRDEIGADILLCSAYKFFGPHVGIAIIRKLLFEKLETYKVKPSPTYIPDKLETGTQNFPGITGIKPAIEFIEKLGNGHTRRERIASGYRQIEKHENLLASMIHNHFEKLPTITLFQPPVSIEKTPTIAFSIKGISPVDFCKQMAEDYGIFTADGHFYATRLAERLGVLDTGGWIRVGIAPYNTIEEIERFIQATKEIISQ